MLLMLLILNFKIQKVVWLLFNFETILNISFYKSIFSKFLNPLAITLNFIEY